MKDAVQAVQVQNESRGGRITIWASHKKMICELPLGMQGPVLCVKVDSPMEKSAQVASAGKA